MQKKLLSGIAFLVTALMLAVVAATASAGPSAPAGKSNTGHLYLYEKVPSGLWPVVEDGAWGKMKYDLSGAEFEAVFNGHELVPGTDYTLMYYPDPWPGTGLICLGSDAANADGDVHIAAAVDTEADLPIAADTNAGAKIWLVLSEDVDCDNAVMVGWNPTEYLFEADLIGFDYLP